MLVSVGDSDTRQPATTIERTITDARHTVGDSDTRQPAATTERRIPDARHTVANCHTRQPGTTGERSVKNVSARYRHALKRCGNIINIISYRRVRG